MTWLRAMGYLLVTLQFALLAGLAWLTWFAAAWNVLAVACWLAATVIGAAALLHNRPGNFNIHPQPHASGRLVTSGPYRWVRHPMYSALLVAAAGCVAAVGSALVAAGALALLLVLWGKSILEEHWMATVHGEYAAYRCQTARFLPGLW